MIRSVIILIILIFGLYYILSMFAKRTIKSQMVIAIDRVKLGLYNNFLKVFSQHFEYDEEISKLMTTMAVDILFGAKTEENKDITVKHRNVIDTVIKGLSDNENVCLLITKAVKIYVIFYGDSSGPEIDDKTTDVLKKYGIWRNINKMESPYKFLKLANAFYLHNK